MALLRGVNVGGRHKLAMADLRALCEASGGAEVATYIQSGNVVFTHPGRSSKKVAAELQRRIEAHTGFGVAVVLRTAAEMVDVVSGNPFPDADENHLHVTFLRDDPPPGALDAVDPAAFAPEAFTLAGRHLYLYLPNGMGRTTLPQALDRFPAPVTTRNWRTVLKLTQLASE